MPFFIAEVVDKCSAEQDLLDKYGHSILAGGMYAEVVYLQKSSENKRKIRYQRQKQFQPVFVHIYEIFMTNIVMANDLTISIDEYHSVLQSAH